MASALDQQLLALLKSSSSRASKVAYFIVFAPANELSTPHITLTK